MTDYTVEPSGEADHLLNHPILTEIYAALERESIEAMLSPDADDQQRRFLSMEVNAIRSVQRKLAEKASGKVKPKRTVPAA